MKLLRVDVRRLAGGESGFCLDDLAPGLNLIVGPNGSGKSSLCRALRATLWPDSDAPPGSDLASLWHAQGVPMRAELGHAVRWQSEGRSVPAPALPAAHLAHTYTLGLRDLLADDSPADRDLAERLQIQMYGGFDLAALRSRLSQRSHGRREEQELLAAERALHRLQGERRRLADEDDRLAALREQLVAARRASEELEKLRAASQRAALGEELEDLRRRFEGFAAPAEKMVRLVGSELEQLDALQADLTRVTEECDDARRRLAQAELDRRACGLSAAGPPDEAKLAAWRSDARELERLIAEGERAQRECARATGAVEAAHRALAGDVSQAHLEGLSAHELEELSGWLTRAFEIRERRSRLESLLEPRVQEATEKAAEPADLEALRRGVDLLREWLATGAPDRSDSAIMRLAVACGCLLALLAAYRFHTGFLGLAGLLLGWLLARRFSRERASSGQRAALEERFSSLGLPALVHFERSAVRDRLSELEAELAGAERAERAAIERVQLHHQLAEVEACEQEIARGREKLRVRLGVDPGLGDLALADLFERVCRWRRAEAELAPLAAASRQLQLDRCDRLSRLGKHLVETLGCEPDDEAHALALLDALSDGCQRWHVAADRRVAAKRDLESCESKRDEFSARRGALLHESGIDASDDPAAARRVLAARLEDLASFRETSERRRALEQRLEDLDRVLEARPDLQRLGRGEAKDRISQAQGLVSASEDVAGQIGSIEERIRAACESGALEEQAAHVSAARDKLLARHDELVLALAGDFMLDCVEGEYEQTSRPAVLQRASDYFARFTRHRCELRLEGSGNESCFRALETESGHLRSLSELSDGTRMQLLLAAKLAFTSQAEGELHPPLFLDEALSASDPERFRAVAESLLALAQSGRQVFYLTCNPADVALWQDVAQSIGAPAPRIFDLAEIRRLAAAAVEPRQLEIPQPFVPPAPDGLDPESYAARLGVPVPDSFAPVESLHLFYLLRDDLPLLHRLLTHGRIERIGNWRAFAAEGSARVLFDELICQRIEARVRVAEAFFEAWRIGRGRSVDRSVLQDSGAVSGIFIDRLASIAAECGGRAAELLETLEAGHDARVKRFRSQQLELLRRYLEERGYLDPSPPLAPDSLRARVLAACAEPQPGDLEAAAPVFDSEEVLRLVDELTALLAA